MARILPSHETLPKYVVLEGMEINQRLAKIIDSGDPLVDYYTPDVIDAYITQIVDCIFARRERNTELDALAANLKHQYEMEGDYQTAVPLAKCIVSVGLEIINQLEMMGVYMPDGTTHYTFSGRDSLGGIILERIDTCHTTIAWHR